MEGFADLVSSRKNVAVLSPEVSRGILDEYNNQVRNNQGTTDTSDDLLARDNWPFYNRIEIPHEGQYEDLPDNFSELSNMTLLEREKLITYMQLLMIHNYNNNITFDLPSGGFTAAQQAFTVVNDPAVSPNGKASFVNADVPLLLHLT